MLGPGTLSDISLLVSSILYSPSALSQPQLSSHLSKWSLSTLPLSTSKLPLHISSFSECVWCWEMASWLLCDETYPGQPSEPFEQWWDAPGRVVWCWSQRWCPGEIGVDLVGRSGSGAGDLDYQFSWAFHFRVRSYNGSFQCFSWQ